MKRPFKKYLICRQVFHEGRGQYLARERVQFGDKGCRIFPDLKYQTFLFAKFSLLEKLAVLLVRCSITLPLTVQIKISITKGKPDTAAFHTRSKIVFVENTTHMYITRHVIRMRKRLLFRRYYGSENLIKHLLVNALLAISDPPIDTVFSFTKDTWISKITVKLSVIFKMPTMILSWGVRQMPGFSFPLQNWQHKLQHNYNSQFYDSTTSKEYRVYSHNNK